MERPRAPSFELHVFEDRNDRACVRAVICGQVLGPAALSPELSAQLFAVLVRVFPELFTVEPPP